MKQTKNNMEVGLIMQKISTKDFYSVKRNKACSKFIYQSGIYPQIPIFPSGFPTLQIASNTSEKKKNKPTKTHLHYKKQKL